MLNWLMYDFGYMWPITRGHFFVFLLFGSVAALCAWRRWPRWITVVTSGLAAWGLAGALVMHYAIEINVPMTMPTDRFLASGVGNVVDLGAGSGRATLMVLMSRPRTVVTGLDRYTGFYGIVDNSPDRLRANARRAGVEDRLRVQLGDMRELPFKNGEFDGALSVAAMDHLRSDDIPRALAETARILKPGGEFLFVTVNSDLWLKLAFPTSIHGQSYWGWKGNDSLWRDRMTSAGLEVVEVGTRPGTLYLLARKPTTNAVLAPAPQPAP
jgi:SAM-dependent methyltransferase